MSETITLEIPEELAQRARALASAGNRRLEDAVLDWIGRVVADPPVESLSDAELLTLCDANLDDATQAELSTLLTDLREGDLAIEQKARLDELIGAYRRGLVLKARALKEAVSRGLRPGLGNNAS